MASFEDMEAAAIRSIYDTAENLELDSDEFTGVHLKYLIASAIGRGFTSAIFEELRTNGLISQTGASTDGNGGQWVLTSGFIRKAEKIVSPGQNEDSQSSSDGNSKSTGGSSYSSFKNRLLLALADMDASGGPGYRNLKNVADDKGLKYQPGWVEKAAYSFKDYGYIKDSFTMGGGPDDNLGASITGEGLEEAERIRIENDGLSRPEPALGIQDSADIWEPLPFEASEEEREKTSEDLEKLKEEVRTSNGYATTHPEEQKSVVWALGAGVNAVREGLLTGYAVRYFLYLPLKKVIERFSEAAQQLAAQRILERIITWFADRFIFD